MYRRLALTGATLSLLAAACTGGGPAPLDDPRRDLTTSSSTTEASPNSGSAGTTPSETTTPAPLGEESPATTVHPTDMADLAGRLVIVDISGNIVTLRPDGSDIQAVTLDGGQEALYFQPQWSPLADRLVWGEARSDGFALVTSDPLGRDRRAAQTVNLPFYFYWSPSGDSVAVLHNGSGGGLELELVDVASGVGEVLAMGAPFYFSWSPDGNGIAAHIGPDQFTLLTPGEEAATLGTTASGYQAPQWTTAGIVHLDSGELRLIDATGEQTPLAEVPGPVSFVADPEGLRVAVQSLVTGQGGATTAADDLPIVPPNVVAVLDVERGTIDVVSARPALGYFWSPDGSALLILVLGQQRGTIDAHVWEPDAGTRMMATFEPAPSFVRDVLQFFPQYAQSLRLWSPGSHAFAFAGTVGNAEGVWVQRLDGAGPALVAPGDWVAWSGQ